jgi:membrane-bound lytic murein transglycosylase D
MKVADAAHKVGMSEAEFRQLNQIPPKMLVRSGSALLVPRSLHMDRDVAEHLADHGQVNLAPEQAARKKSSKQAKAVPQNKGTSQKNPKVNVAAVKPLPKR